jgi:large subunit ribosomal protein L21
VLAGLDGDRTVIDAADLASVSVTARVREHGRGKKIRIFTYKAKHNVRKRRGHRSEVSVIEIENIAV